MTENKEPLAKEVEDTGLEESIKADNSEVIPQEIQEFMDELEALPKEAKAKAILSITQRSYRGPIPPPELLAGYESILPGSADRIIAMTERQQKHRIDLESTVVSSNAKDAHLGVIFAFILGVLVIGGGIAIILLDKGVALGSTFSFVGLATLLSTFVYGTRSNSKERQNKDNDR